MNERQYLRIFSKESNLSPWFKKKILKTMKDDWLANISKGSSEDPSIAIDAKRMAHNMDEEFYEQTCNLSKGFQYFFAGLFIIYFLVFVVSQGYYILPRILTGQYLSGVLGSISGLVFSLMPKKDKGVSLIVPSVISLMGIIIQTTIFLSLFTFRSAYYNQFVINMNYIFYFLLSGSWICLVVIVLSLCKMIKK